MDLIFFWAWNQKWGSPEARLMALAMAKSYAANGICIHPIEALAELCELPIEAAERAFLGLIREGHVSSASRNHFHGWVFSEIERAGAFVLGPHFTGGE